MSKIVKSPLTNNEAIKVGHILRSELIAAYKENHNIDVSEYLPVCDSIDLYKCKESGLRFFSLENIETPPKFYEELYAHDGAGWGYQNEKWEFEQGIKIVQGCDSILDVGCGGGSFLESLEKLEHNVVGLETSAYGREESSKRGVAVLDSSIVRYAQENSVLHDAITSFQVLEHVNDPYEFVSSCVQRLKPGGILLLSVPNNDSFLEWADLLPLNSPPHHLALWNRESLEFLTKLFPLKISRVDYEPLQAAQIGWYQRCLENRYLPKSKILSSAYYRLGGASRVRRFLEENNHTIDGHTIMVTFEKYDINEEN